MQEQLTIDGRVEYLTPDGLTKVTRRVMSEKPITYKSHRLLMIEIAKAWGFRWDALDAAQRYILERLFDSSPDIERAARKVREEDAVLAQSSIPIPHAPDPPPNDVTGDPFEEVEAEMNEKERRRRQWRR